MHRVLGRTPLPEVSASLGKRSLAIIFVVGVVAAMLPASDMASAQIPDADQALTSARESEPIVLSGAQFPGWAVPADITAKAPEAGGKLCQGGLSNECTHNEYEDPEVSSSDATSAAGIEGVPVDRLLGYRWTGNGFEQIPFQVDEMFVRYLSNDNSGFAFYSETDQHTSYAFDREGFRWTDDYGAERPGDPLAPCIARPATEVASDPVEGLDTDDELVFMAKDAAGRADSGAPLPQGVEESFEVAVTDPLTGGTQYIYVMRAADDGPVPEFDATNGYVRYERDDPESENLFLFSESSYENYGAAPAGPWYDPATDTCVTNNPRQRRPSDAATITTAGYRYRYDGRWLMTGLEISNDSLPLGHPDKSYGPDVLDQWKARAFQQRPGGQTPCCGFEEEVNNWGGSSILMGERSGPVRTIRETWGADSGTNVVRREIFYQGEIRFGVFLRVHVIPPLDGIYAQWDYNAGVMTRYYNSVLTAGGRAEGVAIDGKNDEVFGNSRVHAGPDGVSYDGDDQVSDQIDDTTGSETQGVGETNEPSCKPVDEHAEYYERIPEPLRREIEGACVFNDVDSPDPAFSGLNAGLNWEQVGGPSGTVVTRTVIKHATPGGTAQTLLAVPYYRDDSCFDDGTGSDPGPHIHGRGVDGDEESDATYVDPATQERKPRGCWDTDAQDHPDIPGGDPRFYQGSIGTHGVHILAIADSDNAGTTVPLTEIDTEQRTVVLPGDPGNVGETYGRHLEKPLVAVVLANPTQTSAPTEPPPAEMPDCEQDGPEGSRKIEGYIPVAQDSPTEATTLHYQVLLPACKDTDGDGTLDFKGPYPIVVDYSGYQPAITFYDGVHRQFLKEGYAVAGVNIRGTACSGGKFDYFEPRQSKDGAEAIDFLGTQVYSTGKVGMVGKSYPGITQLFVAAQKPKHLAAIVPGHVFGDLYRDVPYPGGIQNTTFAGGWSAGRLLELYIGPQYAGQKQDEECAANQAQHALNPPLNPFVRALYNHYDSEFFRERSPWYFADEIEAPTFLVESWQDEQVGSRATELTDRFSDDLEWRMLATNGDHGEYYGSDVMPEIKDFLSYYLKEEVPANDRDSYGTDLSTALSRYEDEPNVQLNWETGALGDRIPAWKTHHSDWPIPSTEVWRLNLTGDGELTTESHVDAGGPASVDYLYKPVTGTQQRGGYELTGQVPDEAMARWTETPEAGTYALFQTRKLTTDRVLAGPASVDLWVSSTAPDTDFQVTLTEVRPDGKEVFVQQGWLRASHRKLDPALSTELRPFQTHELEDSLPLVPGEPTPVRIEIFPFGHAFRQGSAIRIYVEAPHTKPDLWGFALLPTPARNTIYTSKAFPSSIALPLLPGEKAGAPLPACNATERGLVRNQPCRDALEPEPRAEDPEPSATPSPTPSSTPSPTPSSTPSPAAPEAPSHLNANAVSSSRIDLSWRDNSTTESGFVIERSTDGATWQQIATVGAGQIVYVDSNLRPNTTHHYRVRAFGSGGHSAYSNVARATTHQAPAGASPSPSPTHLIEPDPGHASTTLSSNRSLALYGEGFELSGVVERDENCSGPLEIEISSRERGSNLYSFLETTPVTDDGSWGLFVSGPHNAFYIAKVKTTDHCEGSASEALEVLVKAAIDVKVPRTCDGRETIRGQVEPNKRRAEVILQRRTKGAWRKVDSAILSPSSRFVLRTHGCGLHRVVWPKQDDTNEQGSARFRI